MKKDNPFSLTFGKQPGEYIARYEMIDAVISTFSADRPVSQTYLIEGIRGSGKTVLMTAVANELANQGEWIVIDLNSTQDLLSDLTIRLVDACSRTPGLLKSGFSVSIAGFGIGVGAEQQKRMDVGVLDQVFSSLKKKNKRVIITIDEVQHNEEMRHFASEFQLWMRRDYPVFLLMTGLYENIDAIQNDPALTFLLRTPKLRLEPLSERRITTQYRKIFSIDDAKAKELAALTKGYAFAFQALGLLCWEKGVNAPMEDILEELDNMLDEYVYRKIWTSLSPQDRRTIRAIERPQMRVSEVCTALTMTSATFSTYRDRLSKRGLLDVSRRGLVSLMLPRFFEVASGYEV